jgi:pilus assembly protein Flp/PilA
VNIRCVARLLLELRQRPAAGSEEETSMLKVMNAVSWMKALARKDEGVTAIEYGLIAALIAVVIIGAVTLVGNGVSSTFDRIATAL